MKKIFYLLFWIPVFAMCQEKNFTQYTDPFIGTGGHGHTFPGATTPFGMVQLSPDTRIDGSWDGCSGYHYSDSVIYGFSHTHLSGTGCSDYGDIMLMPMMGTPSFESKIYSSAFSHKNEKASAGYYSVKLLDDNIDVELTASARTGFHKYTFNKEGDATVILDLRHRDKLLEGQIIAEGKTLKGFRRSKAWATDQYCAFFMEFSKPFDYAFNSTKDAIAITFKVKKSESVFIKVGISGVSPEGAEKNLKAELPHWNFEKARQDASEMWNKELSKIEVTGTDAGKLKIFYTALYHTLIQPNIYSDVDHQYRGRDNRIHTAEGFDYYTVFSLWDTFRAAHPLYTLIEQKRTLDFIKTFIAQYEQGGRLPVWELSSNETDCMIGYHSVSVIADALSKGINNFDKEKALEAMKASSTWKHYGLPAYIDHGLIAMEDESENVSRTLEYSYDDWCIAQTAQLLGKKDDYAIYTRRAQYWKNLFDTETGFIRPKQNGGWLSPFEPREVNNNYTEANAWQYTFFVPQDIKGLIRQMGGTEKFEKKLEELFTTSNKTTGRDQADITGLIGQYAHGNEPSHHMAYLFNYATRPWKTQELVHRILTEMYHAAPDGLIGNEDCGQMSAWYVMSSMGIYAVTPGNPVYALGSPLFEDVKIHLENGKTWQVKANGVSDKNFYIQSSALNGVNDSHVEIAHSQILKGGQLTFEMGSAENKTWGAEGPDMPAISTPENEIVPVPVIQSAGKTFKDKTQVILKSSEPGCKLFFTADGSNPSIKSPEYTGPISIDKTTTLQAIAYKENSGTSFISKAVLHKTDNDWKIKINSHYSPQYSAGGDEGIINGLRGDVNWRKGDWQGYQGEDFECVIDMGKEQEISKLGAGFLQDEGSWILFPTRVEFETSADGKTFSHILTVKNTVEDKDERVQVKDFIQSIPKQKARYVKVKAINYGKLPAWHLGAGGDAYIFIDEIMIE